jgi:cytochrome c-type biogenesis protein CcmH
MLKDPVLEARARALSEELRCMVCQNQSIDDSDASLAHDIRVLLRERLAAGDSDKAVIDFLVARYGEFILLKPPFNWHTAVLWIAAPAVLVVGGLVAFGLFRRRRPGESIALSPAERARVEELMARRE